MQESVEEKRGQQLRKLKPPPPLRKRQTYRNYYTLTKDFPTQYLAVPQEPEERT
jgi:hypothetical protein